jgi:hypothetical protein
MGNSVNVPITTLQQIRRRADKAADLAKLVSADHIAIVAPLLEMLADVSKTIDALIVDAP